MDYRQECVREFAQEVKALGFAVYLAESGTHGVISDGDGLRVMSFQYDLGIIKVSGNYHASRESGTGWQLMPLQYPLTAEHIRHQLYAMAPGWTRNTNPTYTTLAEHLEGYNPSSKYTKLEA